MAMKKVKPQFGKVTPPNVNQTETNENSPNNLASEFSDETLNDNEMSEPAKPQSEPKAKKSNNASKAQTEENANGKTNSSLTSEPNPFLQTKEVFGKARLTKIGYRMRSDYVEVLDIIKKMKKGGYTLEAVLDDALTFYFQNSEDGKEAIKKAELFYS